jgi:hypothetical protein
VVAETQDLRWLAEGGVRAHIWGGGGRVRLTEDGLEGAPHRIEWWVGGAKRRGTNEPVRSLYDALKPKLHYAYDRCADAYLRTPS